jgi:hypothetical protein
MDREQIRSELHAGRGRAAQEKDWGALVTLIDRFKPLCERDDGLRFELYYTC